VDALYPPAPPEPPAHLGAVTPRYRRHLAGALVALAAFVGLYAAMIAWLVRTWLHLWPRGAVVFWVGGAPLLLLLAFLISGLFAIRRRSYGDAATELRADDEPALFAFLHRLADDAGAPRPHRVFLVPEVTAAVAYDVALWNLVVPTRKNLLLGVGLVNALTLDELKAVLAHELGHFSQRSTQVGSYTYVAMQIVAHLVGHRGGIDQALAALSVQDIRVAWIGWVLRVVIWAIRAVLDTAFRGVLFFERALSREMEFQADLVAVRLAGSDSIVHALARLVAADEAWNVAIGTAAAAARRQIGATDLYALQTLGVEHLRQVRAEPGWGAPPPLPPDAAAHRVFARDTAVVPQMWSTHPSNPDREENAKRNYLPSALDGRSAWTLFRDPEGLRSAMTAKVVAGWLPGGATETSDLREALASSFQVAWAAPRYHGVWLARAAALHVRSPDHLVGPLDDLDRDSITADLTACYPPELGALVRSWRDHQTERQQLEGLRDGLLEAPGGVVRFRGRELGRHALNEALDEVKADLARTGAALDDHDRRARAAHRRAARALGQGWEATLDGYLRLLHLLEHARADLDDAHDVVAHVIGVVTADGSVSQSEQLQLLRAAREADVVLRNVRKLGVLLFPPVTPEVLPLGAALPGAPGLPEPSSANLGPWLPPFDAWSRAVSEALGSLRGRTLTALLEAEDHVATTFLAGAAELGPAPQPPALPDRWPTRIVGEERPREAKLSAWDRFQLADGWLAGGARLVVAGGILAACLSATWMADRGPALTVRNGLDVPVTVDLGNGSDPIDLPAGGARTLPLGDPDLHVVATLADGRVALTHDERVADGPEGVVLGIGCGWYDEWVRYGRETQVPPPRGQGTAVTLVDRWDYPDGQPPAQLDVGREGVRVRSVLHCVGEPLPDATTPELAALHLGADTPDRALAWLEEAAPTSAWAHLATRPDFAAHRLAFSLAALGLELPGVCGTPPQGDAVGALLTAECEPVGPVRDAHLIAAADALPDEPLAQLVAADALGRGERWEEAAARVLALPPAEDRDWWRLRVGRRGGAVAPNLALGELQVVVDAERDGVLLPGHPLAHFVALAAGDVSVAPADQALVWREDHQVLAGASTGASPALVDAALAATPRSFEAQLIAAALHLRERGAVPPELTAELRRSPRYPRLSMVLEPAKVAEPGIVEGYVRTMSSADRGAALAVACVVVGDAAPEPWRREVRALLLPWERPWLGP